ncbi:MAG: hypothetical protein KF914_14250 [Rhizobiaceae bacterium]|nr:hypothetical protein [Rhizobiaceae bacterium]
MLLPLFSPDCLLTAWLHPGRYVFDAGMRYCAFVTNGHCWSAATGVWLGPVIDGHLYDIHGRPVAWNPSAPLRATNRPLRPVNVVRAIRPVQPVRPVEPGAPLSAPMPPGGWSMHAFAEWLVANDPVRAVLEPIPAANAVKQDEAGPARPDEAGGATPETPAPLPSSHVAK